MLRILTLCVCVGCAPSVVEPPDLGEPPASTEGSEDAQLVRLLIEGSADLDDTLMAIAWSGGWPVHTAEDTWIFLAVGNGESATVSGDFNGWAESEMTAGDGFFWAEIAVGPPNGLGYKLSLDGVEPISDPWARSYTWDLFGQLSYVAPPLDRWHLERWPQAEFGLLEPRDLRVYVPAGLGPWPTVYAHDGQNLFDPSAPWGGWRLQLSLIHI